MDVRFNPPSRYDLLPFGTVVRVMGEGDDSSLYIQVSKEETHANWVKIGCFLEKVFEAFTLNPTFIDSCLNVLEHKKDDNFIQLEKIFK